MQLITCHSEIGAAGAEYYSSRAAIRTSSTGSFMAGISLNCLASACCFGVKKRYPYFVSGIDMTSRSSENIREHRQAPRFELRLPVMITKSGRLRLPATGITANISSTGVLFTSQTNFEDGTPLEYSITLYEAEGTQVIAHCRGHVVRHLRGGDTFPFPQYQVASTIERYSLQRSPATPPPASAAQCP